MPNGTIDTQQKSRVILGQLIKDNLNPIQENVLKTVQKVQKQQVEEAIQAGVPAESILEQVGIPINKQEASKNLDNEGAPFQDPNDFSKQFAGQQQPAQSSQQAQILQPTGLFTKQEILPGGDLQLGGLFDFRGLSLDQLLKAQKITGTSPTVNLELLQEQRRLGQEQRRLRQEEVTNIRDTGITLKEGEIQSQGERLNRDFNSQIEAFGIPATKDKKGNRSFRIPPQKELDRRVANRSFAPAEIEHLNDLDVVRSNMRSVLDEMRSLGISEISEVGVFSDLGKFSVPARFDLVAQLSKDPRFTDLKRRLERVFQSYRKIITGAQASDRELKAIRPLINAFTDQPGVFFQVGESIVNESNRLFENRLFLYEAAGRDTSKFRSMLEKRQQREPTLRGRQQGQAFNLNNVLEGL